MKLKRWFRLFFIAYCLLLLWLTIISRQPRANGRIIKWELFWSYRAWIEGESNGKVEAIQNINNILLFIPFGFLFPAKKWRLLILASITVSALIECVQYIFALGWCEIDDVISNTIGAMIGFGILIFLNKKAGHLKC